MRESLLPNILEPKTRGKKATPVPTTEGVTVNEQVNAFQNQPGQFPFRPNLAPAPAPMPALVPPQLRPGDVRPSYTVVLPPNGYVRPVPKRETYPPLSESLEDIFMALMSHGAIQLPPPKEGWSPHVDTIRYC